ncbi:MAG: hypothetical protein KJ779_12340, partial [Firmicutes bacterium]|nr:hypothetical protein [Bacillota bacterium]
MMTSSSISIIWGIVLSTVPYFMLAFIPVWDQRRFSKMTAVIAGTLCVFLNVVSVIFIIQFFQDWERLHIYYSIFFLLLYIVVYLSMIRGTPSKLIFIALLVKSYADFVMNICKYLEVEYIAHFKNWDYA